MTTFICNQWLQDPDRAVHPVVELLPGGELPVTLHYKVEVVTSDIKVGACTERGTGVSSAAIHASPSHPRLSYGTNPFPPYPSPQLRTSPWL